MVKREIGSPAQSSEKSLAKKVLKTTAIIAASATGIAGLGYLAEGAAEAQANHVYNVGHAAEQQAQQTQEQQDFQQGLENGKVTLTTATPTDGPLANTGNGTEVISPKQITPSTDAPLPSPNTH